MAVIAPQGFVVGPGAGPSSPLAIPLGATTVNSTNPNNFPVYLTIAGGTVTVITINGTATGVTSGTFLVNPSGLVNLTYSVAPTTFRTISTGLTPANSYPFTDPVFQLFTVQQNLQVTGVNPAGTYD